MLCYAPPVMSFRTASAYAFCGLLCVVCVPMVGCSGTTKPSATVTDATIRSRTAEAAVIEFVVETSNPNDIELPMRDVVYTLSLDGRRVFSGRRDAQATMPRGREQRITIPVVVPMRDGGDRGVEPGVYGYRLTGHIYYSLPSQLADVLFDAKLSRPKISISDEGEIDLR